MSLVKAWWDPIMNISTYVELSHKQAVNVRIVSKFLWETVAFTKLTGDQQSFARFDLRLMTSVICVSGWLALAVSCTNAQTLRNERESD